jgi:hypothetical protein
MVGKRIQKGQKERWITLRYARHIGKDALESSVSGEKSIHSTCALQSAKAVPMALD